MTKRPRTARRLTRMAGGLALSLFATLSAPAQSTTRTLQLPEKQWTTETVHLAPIQQIDPPEDDFFARRLDYRGLPIKGAAVVADEAFHEAWRRLDRSLRHNDQVLANLLANGVQVHIIGRDQVTSDLPEYRHMRDVPYPDAPDQTIDTRTRGVGGRNSSCGEENLLNLPGDRYAERDILCHEFAHTIHYYGVSPNVQRAIREAYDHAMEQGLWRGAYASTNDTEYFAELTMWYFGNRGDYGRLSPRPRPGPEWLRQYDPTGYRMLDDFYQGRMDVQPIGRSRRRSQ